MGFPEIMMRERRKDEAARLAHRETIGLSVKDLIMPIFVKEGISSKKEIKSMPAIFQLSLKETVIQAQKIYESGIPSIILFGIPKRKDEIGSSAYEENGVVQNAINSIKNKVPKLSIIADVCLCEYTSHGHCGIIKRTKDEGRKAKDEFIIDNDATIEILAKIALSYAKAGADIVAPSAMMDGQVKAIKEVLIKNNYPKVKIMAYSAKYASSLYGPFRDAAESPPQFGDRKTYQMDYHNSDEAVLEAKLDIEEGADIVMVKPALNYCDIIYRIKRELNFPLSCYSVSGEYSMLKEASAKHYIDEKNTVLEILTSFRRAGADFIITYYALEVSEWLKNKK